ncbi:uncharacterized protein [Montipora capricornis]|uniref:uncharacterized protein n=1 Tax=Montipora capricornis TaxID=246305 RepID=UPI0035F1D330
MADKRKRESGKTYCAAGSRNAVNCSNKSGLPGITMHYFPSDESLRQKWIRFVRIHRKDFVPSKSSALCSAHFDESCFHVKGIPLFDDSGKKTMPKRYLIRGSIPSKDTVVPYTSPLTSRKRRRLLREALFDADGQNKKMKFQDRLEAASSSTATGESLHTSFPAQTPPSVATEVTFTPSFYVGDSSASLVTSPNSSTATFVTPSQSDINEDSSSVQSTKKCGKCEEREKKRKALMKKHTRLKKRHSKLEAKTMKRSTQVLVKLKVMIWKGKEEAVNEEEEPHSPDSDTEEEIDWAALEESAEEYDSESDKNDEESDEANEIRFEEGTPVHEEPKFIVFFTNLLALFSLFCFKCKKSDPRVTMKKRGTLVIVNQHCSKCGDYCYEWRSQPNTLGGKHAAGNVLLSFAILLAGASISKVLLVFRHMGLSAYSTRTFFAHQRNFLFPVIISHWETYQAGLIEQLKDMGHLIWSGDGRFDSMGHSAKYGAYTMFCNTVLKVIHFEILQANETGGSSPMELEGAKRAFSFLQSAGLAVKVFISDRHRGIAKWIRECQAGCAHYFDIWHVARSISKAMIKLGKEKGCEKIADWVKGARNHLYWCVTSSRQGFEELVTAKWKSFMQHVANKHDNHPSPLFKKCAHDEEIENRKWIRIGTKAYDKLNSLLTNVRLVNDIKKLSPDSQTSCLEGFHSTLNHWHPKMVCFSWLGTYCRHILGVLHFNENVNRQTKTAENGEEYFRVTYPKFKLGDEVVREVAVPPTYGYVQAIREELFNVTSKSQLQSYKIVAERYKTKVPPSLSSQFKERVDKPEAVNKYRERQKRASTHLYPSVEDQSVLQSTTTASVTEAKKQRKCRKCGRPMKGHTTSLCNSLTD